MSTSQYLLGAAELAVIAAALGLGAYHLRALLAPAWMGALARLAEVVIGISMLILVSELLGPLGLFEEVPLRDRLRRGRAGHDRPGPSPAGLPEPRRGAGGPLEPGDGRDRDRRRGAGRGPLGPADRAGARSGHVLPGHHLVPHVLLGPVRPDRGHRSAPLHRPAQAGGLVLSPELRAAARRRDRRPRHRLPLAADQPDVGRALPARRLVRRAAVRDRRRHRARRGGCARLGDAGRLPGRPGRRTTSRACSS